MLNLNGLKKIYFKVIRKILIILTTKMQNITITLQKQKTKNKTIQKKCYKGFIQNE